MKTTEENHPHGNTEIIQSQWQGIPLEIRYCPSWSAHEATGLKVAHIEVKSIPDRTPLPITETGYRSHFCHPDEISKFGSAERFVHAWMDEASQLPQWQSYVIHSNQLSMF